MLRGAPAEDLLLQVPHGETTKLISMRELRFRHQIIDPDPPGARHDITLLADLTGDGRPDIVIGGKQGPPNLMWYRNPDWQRFAMADAPDLEAGGVVLDITRNGRPDIVAGQQSRGGGLLFWFEHPGDPRQPWPVHVIEDRFDKYHDQAVADVDADGEPELVFLSQGAGVLGYYDLPEHPRVEPWPRTCFHLISDQVGDSEGLVIIDLDGDGTNEIIAGTNIFRPLDIERERWRAQAYLDGFVKTRVVAADLDCDGTLEIIVCEGESDVGRSAWCRPPDWEPVLLRTDLFHPHSLAVADFDGDGLLEIFVGEMGLGQNELPELIIFRGPHHDFEPTVISRGIPTHEAKVADLDGDGRPDIVGKPYDPQRHVDVWWNEC